LQISLKQQHLHKNSNNRAGTLGQSGTALSLDPVIPSGVTLAEVLGLVEVLGERGFDIPISAGGRSRFFHGSSEFLSLLTTAEILGLVSRTDHRIFLTDTGLGFLKADFPEQMGVLRAKLSRIEPFKSTLDLLTNSKSVNVSEISRKLSEKYEMGDFDPKLTRLVLIEWGLPTGLLKYDTKGGFRLG